MDISASRTYFSGAQVRDGWHPPNACMVREQLATSLAGRYTLERELGRGGMATVFLARDLKHQREVALKVLDPELGAVLGAERFLSEIRVTANLQHPNLLPLFDSGEADGLLYYVMPYVEGESLRARLDREKQLRVDEAVRIAVAVANALGYAHQHGVIHRDLKPENILLQAGQPVIADFGIALAVSNAGGQRVTQTGLSLGTPQYMSPEQATGDRAIDGRTDIYSLGAVLYEMLTGEPPHVGSTAQAIIARLMTEKPRPVRVTRDTVPEHIELAVEIALAKLPADRFPTAFEFANALTGHTVPAHLPVQTAASVAQSKVSSRGRLILLVTPWAIAAAAVAAAVVSRAGTERPENTGMFALNLPTGVHVDFERAGARLALSHDGSQLAYVGGGTGGTSVFVRSIGDTSARRVAGTENAALFGFSPDGRWLLVHDGKLKRVPLAGGTPVVLTDSAGGTAEWSGADEILYTRSGKLWKLSASGGAPQLVATPDSSKGQGRFRNSSFLPGGGASLVTISRGTARNDDYLGVFDLKSGKVTDLGVAGVSPRYVAPGYVIFARGSAVFAAPFSASRHRLTGPAVQILDGVSNYFGALELYAADDGTIAFIGGALGSKLQMVVVDRQGVERAIGDARFFSWPRVSPDGKRIAVEIGTGDGSFDVWLYDVASRAFSRLTNNFSGIRPLGWSTDGRMVEYLSATGAGGGGSSLGALRVARVPWDLSSPSENLTAAVSANPEDGSLGPPHTSLVVRLRGYNGPGDLEIASLDSPNVFKPFVATGADEETPRISPDGKLVAYGSDETGQFETYIRPLAGSGGRIQVSAGGGAEPVWARDSRTLYYRSPSRLMVATIAATPELSVVKRDSLFADTYRREGKAVQYDVFPNGDFLMLKRDERSEPRPMIITNWQRLLRQKSK